MLPVAEKRPLLIESSAQKRGISAIESKCSRYKLRQPYQHHLHLIISTHTDCLPGISAYLLSSPVGIPRGIYMDRLEQVYVILS